ncbi:hypothetical protein ACFOSV_11970 [Algoriphagus namhaensis]|uniref:FkbM family methyltransferase n=1 Tax=Algoriphagus namhaensis TaxID=915353 RepID=A0ABV8AVL5_9BACT
MKEEYIKPEHKIVARFTQQTFKFILDGNFRGAVQALGAYSAYSRYTKRTVAPYQMNAPWIAHFAFKRLENLVFPEMNILEFGSGGSTLYFKDKVQSIYSIEHDEKWFGEIASQFEHFPNVKLNLIQPETGDDFDPTYSSVNGLFSEGKSFKAYAHAADHLEKDSIDLLIIDGRARPQCLVNSIDKLKKGGILLFDNSDRKSYKPVINKLLKGWKREVYAGVAVYDWQFSETSIFFKP